MTNREIIDLKPGQLIATGKRIRLAKIWVVEELIENNETALTAVSLTEFISLFNWAAGSLRPRRTAPPRQRATFTWRNLRDYRRIA